MNFPISENLKEYATRFLKWFDEFKTDKLRKCGNDKDYAEAEQVCLQEMGNLFQEHTSDIKMFLESFSTTKELDQTVLEKIRKHFNSSYFSYLWDDAESLNEIINYWDGEIARVNEYSSSKVNAFISSLSKACKWKKISEPSRKAIITFICLKFLRKMVKLENKYLEENGFSSQISGKINDFYEIYVSLSSEVAADVYYRKEIEKKINKDCFHKYIVRRAIAILRHDMDLCTNQDALFDMIDIDILDEMKNCKNEEKFIEYFVKVLKSSKTAYNEKLTAIIKNILEGVMNEGVMNQSEKNIADRFKSDICNCIRDALETKTIDEFRNHLNQQLELDILKYRTTASDEKVLQDLKSFADHLKNLKECIICGTSTCNRKCFSASDQILWELSAKILKEMDGLLENVSDTAYKTRCAQGCPRCNAPCVLPWAHDGDCDTFHQPGGLVGIIWTDKTLKGKSCVQSLKDNDSIIFPNETIPYKQFFEKSKFKLPAIERVNLTVRNYIFVEKNEQLAKKFEVSQTTFDMPAKPDLDKIENQLYEKETKINLWAEKMVKAFK